MECFILTLCAIFACGLIWVFICNERTYNHRTVLLDCVFGPSYPDLLPAFQRVDYERHLWTLFFFRDPAKLYGNRLGSCLK